MSALNYSIVDLDTNRALITHCIDYADYDDYKRNIDMSAAKFAGEQCYTDATAFEIFAAKFLPDLDQHELNNEFVNEAWDDNRSDQQSEHIVRKGGGIFEVRIFGNVIRCQLEKDRW
jgi:hypothetical protein